MKIMLPEFYHISSNNNISETRHLSNFE